MGFSGSWVLGRLTGGARVLAELAPSVAELDEPEPVVQFEGGWQGELFQDAELTGHGVELTELVAATGAPAMTAFCFDSDWIIVYGLTPIGLQSFCALNAGSYRSEADDDPNQEQVPATAQAVAVMTEWAAEAGLTPDSERLATVLDDQAEEFEFDYDSFLDLTAALGLTQLGQ